MYFPCIILAILENNKNLGYEDFRNSKIETRNENGRFSMYALYETLRYRVYPDLKFQLIFFMSINKKI